MNYRLAEGCLGDLDEQGFCDTYIALKMHQLNSKQPKQFRAAIAELESVLDSNQDLLSLINLVDVYLTQIANKADYHSLEPRLLQLI